MTISKSAWLSIIRKYAHCIQPDPINNVTKEDVTKKVGIDLCVSDVLAGLRSTSVKFKQNAEGDITWSTCREFVETAFDDVFVTLAHTNVKVYVICLDAFGRRRPEKTATAIKRSKRARPSEAPEQLLLKPGQEFFFRDEDPMPGPVDLIFNTPAAKAELYEYITLFLSVIARSRIPDGKTLYLSGGLKIENRFTENPLTPVNLPPIEITNAGWCYREDFYSPSISEGDVDVWQWVHRFPDMNFHVYSYDADVILIGLLQMRRILTNNSTRQGWVVTRRSVSSSIVDERHTINLAKRQRIRKELYDTTLLRTQDASEAYLRAGGSFAEESKRSPRRPNWVVYHLNLTTIYADMLKDAEAHHIAQKYIPNLVETYVLAFILSSDEHDFIQTKLLSRNVGSEFVWTAFEKEIYAFHDFVTVYTDAENPNSNKFYYVVNTDALRSLVTAFYREKANAAIKEGKKSLEKLHAAREKSFSNNISAHGPTVEQINVVASQCAWVLQYWGNGPVPDYTVVDGTTPDEHGNSVYGYTSSGWAETVCGGVYRVCPPKGYINR